MHLLKLSKNSRTFRALSAMGIQHPIWRPWSICDIGSGLFSFIFSTLCKIGFGVLAFWPFSSMIVWIVASLQVGYWPSLDPLAVTGLFIWLMLAICFGLVCLWCMLVMQSNARGGIFFPGQSLVIEWFRSVKDKTCAIIEVTE